MKQQAASFGYLTTIHQVNHPSACFLYFFVGRSLWLVAQGFCPAPVVLASAYSSVGCLAFITVINPHGLRRLLVHVHQIVKER